MARCESERVPATVQKQRIVVNNTRLSPPPLFCQQYALPPPPPDPRPDPPPRPPARPPPLTPGWTPQLPPPPPQVLKDSWGVGRIRTGCSCPPVLPPPPPLQPSRQAASGTSRQAAGCSFRPCR